MLHLLLGTDWTANRDEVMKRIAADVAGRRGNRILMVPELISHETERRLCAAAGDTASRYAEVLSFTRLARRVADSMGSAAEECLDNGGRVVAMAAAAKNLSSRLKAYAAVETKPEFLTGLIDAVDEFKRCCISSADLSRAAGETEGSLAQKLEELSLLMESYDALCSRGKRDPRDQMTWLLEQMEQGDFAREHVFYIDGFPDFTRQHLAILEHLISCFAAPAAPGWTCRSKSFPKSACPFLLCGRGCFRALSARGRQRNVWMCSGRNRRTSSVWARRRGFGGFWPPGAAAGTLQWSAPI